MIIRRYSIKNISLVEVIFFPTAFSMFVIIGEKVFRTSISYNSSSRVHRSSKNTLRKRILQSDITRVFDQSAVNSIEYIQTFLNLFSSKGSVFFHNLIENFNSDQIETSTNIGGFLIINGYSLKSTLKPFELRFWNSDIDI